MEEIDPERVEFNTISEMMRDGKVDKECRKRLVSKCSILKKSFLKFESSAEYLVFSLISKLEKNKAYKMAKITATNSSKVKMITERQAKGLPNQKNVCVFKCFIY